jgi:uncharacterized protein (DUF433 family)
MTELDRITSDPGVMDGKPCIRGTCVTVEAVVGMIASGATFEEILHDYPNLKREDLAAAESYPSSQSSASPTGQDVVENLTKPRPTHQRTLQILRGMSPREKLAQVFKLNERTLKLMRIGLRRRFPDLDDAAFEKVYLQMRARCHNRNY